tara:strand:+ start:253 stop:504 length:252 start_codon:yes stop_codon:yes gene_type:complete
MAIEKTIEQDRIEVVGQYKAVQIRTASVIKEGGKELTRSFHRHVVQPDSDISGETAEVQAICNAVWTDAVKAAWTEFQAAQVA